MNSLVFAALAANATTLQQYVTEPSLTEDICTCKGCGFKYHLAQVFPVENLGPVCKGCVTRLSQMFLKGFA